MPLAVETGAGLAGADAYDSLANVDAYHDARGNAAWAAASEAVRERAIRNATAWLDACYEWRGLVKSQSQGLRWPRVGPRRGAGYKASTGGAYYTEPLTGGALVDRDGRELTGVPRAVREACAEAALLALSGPLLTAAQVSSAETRGAQKRVKADTVEVEWFAPGQAAEALQRQSSGALANGAAAHIDRLLTGLYVPAAGGRLRVLKG